MTHSNRHKGRQQVLRCAEEIMERRRYGEPVLTIFDDLSERGAVDLAYRTFCRWSARLERGEIGVGPMITPARQGRPFSSSNRPHTASGGDPLQLGRTSIQTMDELKPKNFRQRSRIAGPTTDDINATTQETE